jgi:hypothetical protein
VDKEKGLTFLKERLEELGFNMSKPYNALIADSYINTILAKHVDPTNFYASFGFLVGFFELVKVVPKGLYIHTNYFFNRNGYHPNSFIYNVPGFPIFRSMLDVQQARNYYVHGCVEKHKSPECLDITHIHNCVRLCVRLLLTLYFHYDDIPLCVPDNILKTDLKIPSPHQAPPPSPEKAAFFQRLKNQSGWACNCSPPCKWVCSDKHLKQQSVRSCECACKRPCEWYERMQKKNQNNLY